MLHHKGNEGKPAWPRWHSFRDDARRDAFSEEEFGEIDQVTFDLEADDPRSAGITGEDNPDTYTGENTTPGDQPDVDGRDLDWR